MTLQARSYITFIILCGVILLTKSVTEIDKNELYIILLWIIIATPFEIKPIRVSADMHYTLSIAIHLAIIIIYGYDVAIIVAALVTTIIDLIGKRGLIKVFFNMGQFAVSIYLSGLSFYFFKRSSTVLSLPEDILAFICASIIYALLNLFLVSVVVGLVQKRNIIHEFKSDLRMVVLYFAALAPISMSMVLLYKEQPLSMFLIVPPLLIADSSFRSYISLKNETKKTLETLADFIDKRDHSTAEHSMRVAQHACAIAKEMGLEETELELIELAGRVHDLGKISIRDDILFKRNRLTEDEMKIMRTHPEVAYNILRSLHMYKNGSIIVREHHERYDGKGYPRGLKEKEIHIGSRIISVADSFDAMTSDRPYRKAMGYEEAIHELKSQSGKQFDPDVVNAFLKVIARERNIEQGNLQEAK